MQVKTEKQVIAEMLAAGHEKIIATNFNFFARLRAAEAGVASTAECLTAEDKKLLVAHRDHLKQMMANGRYF